MALEDFLKNKNMENINIIKIDIEGGEEYIKNGLDYISKLSGINILLSLHTPFWTNKEKTAKMLLEQFEKFYVFTDGEERISREEIEKKMLLKNPTVYEGRTGVFFTIILKTRCV
jgi:hypothetical protein